MPVCIKCADYYEGEETNKMKICPTCSSAITKKCASCNEVFYCAGCKNCQLFLCQKCNLPEKRNDTLPKCYMCGKYKGMECRTDTRCCHCRRNFHCVDCGNMFRRCRYCKTAKCDDCAPNLKFCCKHKNDKWISFIFY